MAVTRYDIRYRVPGTPDWTQVDSIALQTSYRVEGLRPGTVYELQVRAHDSEGEGRWSSSGLGATTPGIAYSFRHRRTGATDWAVVEFLPDPAYRAEGLEPGTEYEAQVRAANRADESEWNASGTASTQSQATAPTFADDTGDAATWTVGTAIDAIIVPEASGTPAPTYAVEGNLPSGLSFDDSTRQLTGTPEAAGTGTIVIRATNSAGFDDYSIPYTISSPPNVAPTVSIDTAATTIDAGATLALAATADDPDGTIASHAWTGQGSFDPADAEDTTWTAPSPAAQMAYTLRLTVTDDDGAEAHAEVMITVRAALTAPSFADDTGDAISGTVGTAIAAVTIPPATGNPNPAYSQIGASPSGITVTLPTLGNDGSITGTPTAAASGTITVRATNSEGNDDWTVSYDFAAAGPALVLADLDDAGLLVDCKVLIEAGAPPAVWGIAPRTVSGTLVDGEFGLGSTDETATLLRFRDALFGSGGGGTHITINDNGALDLQAYFTDPQDGALNTLTIMNAAQETIAFSAGDTRAAGNPNFTTFAVPAEHQAFVAAIAEGQRFIFRMARPEPTPTEFRVTPRAGAPTVAAELETLAVPVSELRAAPRTGVPTVAPRVTLGPAPTDIRASPRTGAPTVAATLTSTEASAPLTLDDLDDSGLLLDCKALIEAGEPPHLWRIRDGVIQGTLLDGDFVLGPDDIAVEWLRRRAGAFSGAAGGTHITLNDADTTKHLGNYFISPSDGALNTLTIMNEARETVSFSAGDTRVAGGDRFVTFAVPAEHQSFVAGIAEGQRFIFRMTRPGPTAIELRARPASGAPTVRPRFVSIDRSPSELRALPRTGAPSVAARLATSAVDVSNLRAQPSTGAPTVAATLTSIAAGEAPVTIDTIPAVAGEVVRMLITAGEAGAGSWYSRFTRPNTDEELVRGSISADSDNTIIVDPTPDEIEEDVELSVDRVQWTADGNNRLRLNRDPIAQNRPAGFGPVEVSFGRWLTGDTDRNELVQASNNPAPGLGTANNNLQAADPGADLAIYLAFADGAVHEVRFNTYFYTASFHFLHVRLDDAAVRAAANAVAVDDLINLVIGNRSDLAPPVLPTEFRATPATGVPTVTPRLTLGPPPIVLRASPRTGAPTVAAVLETLAVQVSEFRATPRTGAPSLRARLLSGTTTEMRALPATGPPRVRAALTSSGDRFLTAYASIADVTEPDIFALFASAFAFTFNSRDEPLPEHQDVIFRATVGSMHNPADLVWSSQNEVGAVIPLRLPRRLLIAGGQEAQSLIYGSLTVDRPLDFPFPNAFGPGHVIQSLAHVGGANYMIVTSGTSGHRLERFVVDADGTVSAQSTALMLAGGADDVFSISGADVNDDALILRNADGTISMRRYRGASNDVIDLAEAQLVDLQLLNEPHGMAHHDTQNILVVDNTANDVPALYYLQVTQNAVASIQALGTVTAMSGLTARALTIDVANEAVIAASDGRMWRVFYDLTAGFIGEAVAMTRPNGLISSVAGLAPLPQSPVPGVRWLNLANFGASQRVAVTVTDPDNDTDTVTISRLRSGADAITVIATNEAIVLPTSAAGVVSSYLGASGEIRVYRGTDRLTTGLTFTRVAVEANLSATVDGTSGAYEITNLAAGALSANLVIRIVLDGEFTIDKIVNITKARQGDRGAGSYDRAISGIVWSDSEANIATEGENRIGDRVTLYNSALRFSETRRWTGLNWEMVVQVIDGSLIVLGTIGGNALKIGAGLRVDADGNLFVDNIDAGVITTGLILAGNLDPNALTLIPLADVADDLSTITGTVFDLLRDIPGIGDDTIRTILGAGRVGQRSGQDSDDTAGATWGISESDLLVGNSETTPPIGARIISLQGDEDIGKAYVWKRAAQSNEIVFRQKSGPPITITEILGLKGTRLPQDLSIPDIPTLNAQIGEIFNYALPNAQGGTAPYTYAIAEAIPGIAYNAANHTVFGTPTGNAQTYSVTLSATDSATPPVTVSKTFDVVVAEEIPDLALAITGATTLDRDGNIILTANATGGTGVYTYAWEETGEGSIQGSTTGRSIVYRAPTGMGAAGTGTVTVTVTSGDQTETDAHNVSWSSNESGDANAPNLTINGAGNLDENQSLFLSVTPTGGNYDTISYAWAIVSGGGALSSSSGTGVSYTPPNVSADTTVRVRVTATARGTGINAAAGTSDTSTRDATFTVRVILPNADAPSLSLTNIVSLDEDETQLFIASIAGGTYDSGPTYSWSVVSGGGTLSGFGSSRTYTPPDVSSATVVRIRCTIEVTGTGGTARSGTSDTASADELFVVNPVVDLANAVAPSISIAAIADFNEGLSRVAVATIAGGTYDTTPTYQWEIVGGGSFIGSSTLSSVIYQSAGVDANTEVTLRCTVTVEGDGTTAVDGSSANRSADVEFTVLVVLPDADAPSLSLTNIVSLDEDETQLFSASIAGGTYDSGPTYTWSVISGGGTLSGFGSSRTYTPPDVSSATSVRIRCTIEVAGTGNTAASGTSATRSADETFTVNPVVVTPVVTAPGVPRNVSYTSIAQPKGSYRHTFQWDAPLSWGTGATRRYGLRRGTSILSDTTLTILVFTSNDMTETLSVRAETEDGESDWVTGT